MTEISFFVCVFVRQTATHSGCCCCKSKFTGSRCCRSVMGEYLSIYLLFFLRKIIPVYKVVISKEEIYWRNPRARRVSSWMPIDLPFWKVLLTELFNSSFWNSSSFYLKKEDKYQLCWWRAYCCDSYHFVYNDAAAPGFLLSSSYVILCVFKLLILTF